LLDRLVGSRRGGVGGRCEEGVVAAGGILDRECLVAVALFFDPDQQGLVGDAVEVEGAIVDLAAVAVVRGDRDDRGGGAVDLAEGVALDDGDPPGRLVLEDARLTGPLAVGRGDVPAVLARY
jgi:hypothetical protein